MTFPLYIVVLECVATVAVIVSLVQVVSFVMQGIAKRAGASAGLLHTIRDEMALISIILSFWSVISIAGLTSEFTTLTLSGIVGIIISLALQSTLSNMIAGVLLFHDKMVRLGNEIQFGGVRGTVVRIALRSTWMRTQDGNVVTVGNSNLSAGPLVNFSAAGRFAGEETVRHKNDKRTGAAPSR